MKKPAHIKHIGLSLSFTNKLHETNKEYIHIYSD